jgi:hypothetical protein
MASTSTSKKKTPSQTERVLSKITDFFSPRNSSQEGDDPELNVVYDDIQALRTMITMLSLIQQPSTGLKVEDLPSPVPRTLIQNQQLRILTALATVLVMEHEKVAVVEKRGNRMGAVEVVACTDSIVAEDNTAAKSLPTKVKHLWNLIVAENPRRNEPSCRVTIVDSKANPDHPREVTLDKLKADLKSNW